MQSLPHPRYASAFHFLSASINLRPSRGGGPARLVARTAVCLPRPDLHADGRGPGAPGGPGECHGGLRPGLALAPPPVLTVDTQAVSLDSRDPAVALNYAVFLARLGKVPAAAHQMKNFEARVTKLRQTPGLDADPDVREGGGGDQFKPTK